MTRRGLRHGASLLVLCGFTFLGVLRLDAQQAGALEGRIYDGGSGAHLTGAIIAFEGTSFGTSTDTEGRFRLRGLPPGSYRVQVRYLGYHTHQASVTVRAGEVTRLDVPMQQAVIELTGVVATGLRSGQQRALAEQFAAENIKSVVDQEQMELFPDMNTAEVLSRVPGVNISRSRGEGKYVYLRGVEPSMTNVTVNGQVLGTTRPETRTHALDVVSADQLASIEVVKAITAEMDANATGGALNLRTRGPFDRPNRQWMSVKLGSGQSELGSLPLYQAALSYSGRVGADERFGIAVSGNYDRVNRYSHQNELGNWRSNRDIDGNTLPHVLEEFMLLNYQNVRDRYGVSGVLEYRPSETSRFYVNGMLNQRTDDQDRQRYRTRFDVDVYLDPFTANRGRLEYEHHDRNVREQMHAATAGAGHRLGAIDLDYSLGYSFSVEDKPDGQLISTFRHTGRPNLAADMSNPQFPQYTVTNIPNWDEMVNDLGEWRLNNMDWRTERAADRNLVGQLNLRHAGSLAGSPLELRFGTKAHFKNKNREDERSTFEWVGDGNVPMSQFVNGTAGMSSFLNGHYTFGPRADRGALMDFFNAHKGTNLRGDTRWDDFLATNFDANEDVYSYYGMGSWTRGALTAVLGMRHELTRIDYTGNVVEFSPSGDFDGTRAVDETRSYHTLFPNLHLRYQLAPLTNLRFAATRSIARPNFSDLVPYQFVDLQRSRLSRGNPALDPTTAYNVDLMAEHYLQGIGILAAGVFYKRLSDIIYPHSFRVSGGELDEWLISEPINGGDADLYGLEVNWQQQFAFLPRFLGGLGVFANYTHTRSRADLLHRDWSSLPGQSGNVGNVALTYDKYGLNARLAMNYNGRFLAEVRESSPYDRWQDSYRQLDLSASYRAFLGTSVFVEANNLLDEPDRMYVGDPSRPRYTNYYGRWIRFGVRYH